MAVRNKDVVTLDGDQLNDLDEAILSYLAESGRATPSLLRDELTEQGIDTGVRQNVNNRLTRLREHGHVRNVRDSGVYELVDDPRAD